MVGYRQRNRIAKTPTGNRKGSRVTEITGSLFSCPHSEIKQQAERTFATVTQRTAARDANLAEPSQNACLIVKEA